MEVLHSKKGCLRNPAPSTCPPWGQASSQNKANQFQKKGHQTLRRGSGRVQAQAWTGPCSKGSGSARARAAGPATNPAHPQVSEHPSLLHSHGTDNTVGWVHCAAGGNGGSQLVSGNIGRLLPTFCRRNFTAREGVQPSAEVQRSSFPSWGGGSGPQLLSDCASRQSAAMGGGGGRKGLQSPTRFKNQPSRGLNG